MSTPMQGTRARKTPFERDPNEDLEDLRDDCIALFLNSRMTQKDITARGGPTPATISKWLYKETRFPRYETIQNFLKALGSRLAVVTANQEVEPVRKAGSRKPVMPPKPTRKFRKAVRVSEAKKTEKDLLGNPVPKITTRIRKPVRASVKRKSRGK